MLVLIGGLFTVVAGSETLPQQKAPPPSVEIRVGEKRIDFLRNGQVIASYHTDSTLFKPHFHPILAPNGKPINRRYPMEEVPGETKDHKHHRGLWFCHGDVIPEGMTLKHKIKGVAGVDFWAEGPGHGRIVCVETEQPKQHSEDHVSLRTRNEWRTFDGEKVMDEVRTIHFINHGATHLILEIELIASVCPITFGDTKEGCLGVRVADSMTEKAKGGVLENAQGHKGEKNCWGRLSAWCDYSGKVDGEMVGVAIMADPWNPWPSAWHARGYGLLAANPFGRNQSGFPARVGQTDLVRLAKGGKLSLTYDVLIHAGDAVEGHVAEHFEWFIRRQQPPVR
jgi:hypothetical protein